MEECEIGYYCPEGSGRGIQCPAGYACTTEGMDLTDYQSELCSAGYYCIGGASKTNPDDGSTGSKCPAGHYCPEGSYYAVPCPIGYYSPNQ
jgi:hypothetical protein